MVVQAQVLTFEQFEIRLRERVLLVQGERVSLGGKAFDVLVALAERCDRVVSKAELLDLAWPGVVVEDNNLSVQITALRRVLGADSITTVTGRGYRLSAAHAARCADAGDAAHAGDRPAGTAPGGHRAGRCRGLGAAGGTRPDGRGAELGPHAPGTHRTQRAALRRPAAGTHCERVLVDVSSAVEAVAWSVELQALLADRREQVVEGETDAMHMRIAIRN